MKELSAQERADWLTVVRRRQARDRVRSRRAALEGRLRLYDDLLAGAATRPDDELLAWRAELHTRIADELKQRAGVAVAEQFLTAAHEQALRSLWAGL